MRMHLGSLTSNDSSVGVFVQGTLEPHLFGYASVDDADLAIDVLSVRATLTASVISRSFNRTCQCHQDLARRKPTLVANRRTMNSIRCSASQHSPLNDLPPPPYG